MKYKVRASISGTDFSFRPNQLVVAGSVNDGETMERSMLETYLLTGDVEVFVDPKDVKETKSKPKASQAVSAPQTETADATPVK